jgi:hypothetical protein
MEDEKKLGASFLGQLALSVEGFKLRERRKEKRQSLLALAGEVISVGQGAPGSFIRRSNHKSRLFLVAEARVQAL